MATTSKPKKATGGGASKPAAKAKAPVKKGAAPAKPAPKKPEAKSAAKPVKVDAKAGAKGAAVAPKKAAAGKPAAPAKPVAAKPAPGKPAPVKGAAPKAPEAKGAPAAGANAAAANGKKSPKGITIVNPKQVRKAKPKVKLEMPRTEPLIKPGQKWKPLIPSGPKAPPSPHGVWRAPGSEVETEFKIDPKARMGKKDLEKYREILLRKRAELLGDISTMEEEALRTNSGSLSTLPQHMAEQGSDTFDQSLSLDLAAVDRNLLREIEDAIKRIDDGTYGVCMKTGKRISAERLAELPWARYSIEAAREMERNPRPVSASVSEESRASSGGDLD